MASLLIPSPTFPLPIQGTTGLSKLGRIIVHLKKLNHCSGGVPFLKRVLQDTLSHSNFLSQKNLFTTSPALITSPSARRSGRGHESCSVIRATSVEGDVLVKESSGANEKNGIGVVSMHHVGVLCENLEKSLEFYQNVLGLEINEARPHDKLPYRGAWLWVGSEMIHIMELPNPDPLTGRPEHGGRDRHACIAIRDVSKLKEILDKAGIPYTLSKSGRPAIFTRDPDANALEFTQVDS